MPPKFYNLADQKLFENYQFLPQEKYRLGLTLPTDTSDDVVTDEGIVNTNAFANAGGDGPDPNTIVNQNYDPYPYRKALEMSFVGATDPMYFNQSFDPSGAVADAQQEYNEFQTAPSIMGIDTPVGKKQAQYESALNEIIMDNQERYRTQGQYETVPSEFAYSTDTEAQKMMDNYPGYYEDDDEEPTGLRALISKGVNLIPGMGVVKAVGNVLGGLMPVSQTAILKNELAGFGIGVNEQGQIVGDRNTLEGIMAGKNVSRLTESSLDKQIDTLRNTLGEDGKYGLSKEVVDKIQSGEITDEQLEEDYGVVTDLSNRLRLSDIGKTQLKDILDRKDIIFDYRKKQKEKKKKDTTTTTDNNQDGDTTTSNNTTNNTGTTINDYQSGVHDYGDNDGGAGEGAQDNNQDNNAGTGTTSGGHGYQGSTGSHHYKKGGRVKYFYGGKV